MSALSIEQTPQAIAFRPLRRVAPALTRASLSPLLVVALPRAYVEVRAGGRGNFDAEELAGLRLVVREVLQEVLRAQLGGDLAEDRFEVCEPGRDEGAAARGVGELRAQYLLQYLSNNEAQ